MTEQQVIAELNHLGKRKATWMGRTLSPETARECVRRGWARIDGDGYYLLTEAGREERSISDCGFGEFKRQLTYKSQWRGNQLILADRWFPSSKTCSDCGEIYHDLALSQRSWTCDACGACHDRDLNAAVNLENLALNSRVTACGEGVSPGSPSALGRPSVKQETLTLEEK